MIEVVVETQDVAALEREFDAELERLLEDDLPLRISWSAQEPSSLTVHVSEPYPVFELSGQYIGIGRLQFSSAYELAEAVGEYETYLEIEAELAAERPASSSAGRGRRRCDEGSMGRFALCLAHRALTSEQAPMASPQEVQVAVARFLEEHKGRLPKSRTLHAKLHEGDLVDIPGGVEGKQSLVLSSYNRENPGQADGTVVVLTIACWSCEGFPYPGSVSALVFVPLSTWAPGDAPFQLWPPPPGVTVHYGGSVPRV